MEDIADDTLPPVWLRKNYLGQLNNHEKVVFEKAVGELASSGLVEYAPGGFPKVTLTTKGERLIHG